MLNLFGQRGVWYITLQYLMSNKMAHLKKPAALRILLFKYVWPFSAHQALKGQK